MTPDDFSQSDQTTGHVPHDSDATAALPDRHEPTFTGDAASADRFVPPALEQAFRTSRYRPRQLLAHGGLGEVYVAEDVELGRSVALKRIRDGRGQHSADTFRFRREAEITGRLEHPGVVPIYGLGNDAAGRPFYAMRFIDGETLADAIAAFHRTDHSQRDAGERGLALRQLLNRFVAACQAVAFAHARGVVHRDIKPANIMLGRFGETLVVDWGLAKHAGESAAEAEDGPIVAREGCIQTEPTDSSDGSAPTEAGSVLGTPGFMSPEQATGRWDAVGPASDIFSLGATLYMLLAGRQPYKGELALEDAAQGRYLAPRRHKADIAAELEAIVLKAMARNPKERYATAQELALDVDRWLGQEPVSVYREPWSKRAARWVRRHRTLVTAAGAALAVAVIGLTIGSIFLNTARRNELAAKQQAEALAADVARQRDDAQTKFRLARRAVDDMLTAVSDKLRSTQDVPAVRRQLLQQALEFYQQFLQERGDDPEVRFETAQAFFRAASIHDVLGENQRAESEYRRALAILASLREQRPNDERATLELASVQNDLAWLLNKINRFSEAEAGYLAAIELLDVSKVSPANSAGARDKLARSQQNLAYQYEAAGRRIDAEKLMRASLASRRSLAADFPEVEPYQRGLAASYVGLGSLLSKGSNVAEAESSFNSAVAIWRSLFKRSPEEVLYRDGLADSLQHLGTFQANTSRVSQAQTTFAEVLELRQRLMEQFPTVPEWRLALGRVAMTMAWAQRTLGKPVDAESTLRRGIAAWEKLESDFPDVPAYRYNLGHIHNDLGWILSSQGRNDDAKQAYLHAQSLLEKVVEQFPAVADYRQALSTSYNDTALIDQDNGRTDEACANYAKAMGLRENLVRDFPGRLDLVDDLGGVCCNRGNLEQGRGKAADSLPFYSRAIEVLSGNLAHDARRTTTRFFLSNAHWGRARALTDLKRYPEALADWDKALELAPPENKADIQLGRVKAAILSKSK